MFSFTSQWWKRMKRREQVKASCTRGGVNETRTLPVPVRVEREVQRQPHVRDARASHQHERKLSQGPEQTGGDWSVVDVRALDAETSGPYHHCLTRESLKGVCGFK